MGTNENQTRESVCERLDEVVKEFFSTLTALNQEQDKLENGMKNGFYNMSRARYSMGLQSVGIEQCDENKMRALVKISLDDTNQMTQYHGSLDLALESQLGNLDIDDGANVRKRNTKTDNGNNDQNVELTDLKKGDSKIFDPIKWFGVLVPPALRQSQEEFKKCAESAVNLANLKVKISALQEEYTTLLKKKDELS